jgi:hypothetical protein
MDNQEKLATLDTKDTGRKQTKQKQNTESYKDEQQQNVGHHYLYNNIN